MQVLKVRMVPLWCRSLWWECSRCGSGPFLLTNLLLDALQKSATEGGDARIVIITSSMHEPKSSKRAKSLFVVFLFFFVFFNSPLQGRGDQHLRWCPIAPADGCWWWFHRRLVGIVGTLCGWRVLSTFAKGARNGYHNLSRGWDLNRRRAARNPKPAH